MAHRPPSRARPAVAALLLAAIASSLPACGVTDPDPYGEERLASIPGRAERVTGERTGRARPNPWELWPYHRDLDGRPITDRSIHEGDERHKEGRTAEALATYMRVPQKTLPPEERKALAYRVASTLLSAGRPQEALASLSRYFAASSVLVQDVDPRFSLLLGWGYAQSNDPEQALAWFSRAHVLSRKGSDIDMAARYGVELLLGSLPASRFETLVTVWRRDDFISRIAAEERRRRGQPGYRAPEPLAVAPAPDVPIPGERQAEPAVAVLLPLSGNFGGLGKKTRNGVELALGDAAQSPVKFFFHDSSGDTAQATAQVRELIGSGNVSAILGPLLSDPAVAVSDVAREYGIPIVNLSKRDNLRTGSGVFRLGVTNASQVRSLLDTASGSLGLSRFAVVYPEDENGRQFAEGFRREAAARGLQILFESSYQKGDLNALVSIASQLETFDVDGIFFPDNLTNAARFFSSLSPAFKTKARPLGTANWDNQTELLNSRAALDRAVFVTPFFAGSARPLVRKFVEAYRAAYNEAPDFLAAQGFDAATLMIAALKRRQAEAVSFDQALASIDTYRGVTGEIRIDPSGEIVRHYLSVEFVDGGLREVDGPGGNGAVRDGDYVPPSAP